MEKGSIEIDVNLNKTNLENIMIMCNKISNAIKEYLDIEEEKEVANNDTTNFFKQRFNKVN